MFHAYNDAIINLLGECPAAYTTGVRHMCASSVHTHTHTHTHFNNSTVCVFTEKFFDMKKADAKEALEIYRRFPPIGDRVKAFLQVAKVHILEIYWAN